MRNNIIYHKITLSMICALISLCTSSICWPTTYYVDATGGNDSNAGTATDSAWKTISKINRSSFLAGDNVLFKKGETWLERLVVPSSGSEVNVITLGAYGSGALPILDAGTAKTGWSLVGGRTYTYSVTETAPYLSFFYERNGTTLVALIPKTSVTAVEATAGTWWLDAANDLLYVHTTDNSNPATNGKRYAAGLAVPGDSVIDIHRQNITIKNLWVGGGYFGIYIHGSSDNVTVDNATMMGNLVGGVFAKDATTKNIIVRNSTVSYCGNGIRGYEDGNAVDTMNVTNNTISNINYNDEFSTSGLEQDGEGISNQGISNFTATGNTISYVKVGIDMYVNNATISNAVVNRNNISHTKLHGIRMEGDGTGNYVSAVVSYNIVNASLDSALGAGIYLTIPGGGSSYAVNNNVLQYKNNFQVTANGNGWVVKNNISVDPVTYHVATGSGMATDSDWNNNIYYQASGTKYWAWNGNTVRTSFATYQSDVSPNENASIQSNPLFVSSSDFFLQSSSPAINAGTTVGLTQDYVGNKVSVGSAPDIGAFEFKGVTLIPLSPSYLSVQ